MTRISLTDSSRISEYKFTARVPGQVKPTFFQVAVRYGTGSRLTIQAKLREATGKPWTIGSDLALV